MSSEQRLERARSGDQDAWRELYSAHAGRLVVWLKSFHSTDSASSAEDIAGEAWLIAAEGLHAFDGEEHEFAGWLFGIAKNLRRNELRKTARRRTDAMPSSDPLFESPVPAEEQPGSFDNVRAILATLPPREREVLATTEVVGLDTAQAAAALGMSQSAVRVTRHRALNRLRGSGLLAPE